MLQIDELVKTKMAHHHNITHELQMLDRKQHKASLLTRDLSHLSFTPLQSEYFETFYVVFPSHQKKDWLNRYEGGIIPEGVMPRSSELLVEEEDYSLASVTVMKKHAADFVQMAAQQKYFYILPFYQVHRED